MMITIRVDTNKIREKIEQLKVEKKKIDDVLESFKGDTLQIGDYWTGEAGDKANEKLVKYTNVFDHISNKLESYIQFLEKVALSYENKDNAIIKQIEEDGNTSII